MTISKNCDVIEFYPHNPTKMCSPAAHDLLLLSPSKTIFILIPNVFAVVNLP